MFACNNVEIIRSEVSLIKKKGANRNIFYCRKQVLTTVFKGFCYFVFPLIRKPILLTTVSLYDNLLVQSCVKLMIVDL